MNNKLSNFDYDPVDPETSEEKRDLLKRRADYIINGLLWLIRPFTSDGKNIKPLDEHELKTLLDNDPAFDKQMKAIRTHDHGAIVRIINTEWVPRDFMIKEINDLKIALKRKEEEISELNNTHRRLYERLREQEVEISRLRNSIRSIS